MAKNVKFEVELYLKDASALPRPQASAPPARSRALIAKLGLRDNVADRFIGFIERHDRPGTAMLEVVEPEKCSVVS